VTRECHAQLLGQDAAGRDRSVHEPAADGECAACHDLALPPEARFVKGAPAVDAATFENGRGWDVQLCAGCHGEESAFKEAGSGATGFMDGGRNLHALHVQAARGPRCLPCHDPHASRQPKLLREQILARGDARIPQQFRSEPGGGWCRTGCHAPKGYRR
jgi:predicted CXXCH cytochrome family protein